VRLSHRALRLHAAGLVALGVAVSPLGFGPPALSDQRPVQIIVNQVGPSFTPVLARAIAAWEIAGDPIDLVAAYGGPGACEDGDQRPANVTVVCIHDTTNPQYAGLSTVGAGGHVWLRAGMSPSTLLLALTHELGHSQGLGHQLRSKACTMYPSLYLRQRVCAPEVAELKALVEG